MTKLPETFFRCEGAACPVRSTCARHLQLGDAAKAKVWTSANSGRGECFYWIREMRGIDIATARESCFNRIMSKNNGTMEILTLKEVADLLGVHPNTVRVYIADGRLRKLPMGSIRIARSEIERFIYGDREPRHISEVMGGMGDLCGGSPE